MSYIDETYGKQLEEALRGLVSRPALGQPWFGFHESEVPAGVLLFTATTHSRVLYADFWKYIQDKNLVKTEEEWQSIYSEQGWCPFYSDGDGIDTFRMPSAPLYLHGANTLGEAGKYIEAGLPNLAGSFDTGDRRTHIKNATGVFYSSVAASNKWAEISSTAGNTQGVGFDASRANPIYGKSDTVTPETSKMLFGVWAISAPQQPIPDATVEGIISELGVASNNALEAKNGLNGVVRSINGEAPDAAGNVSDIAAIGEANGASYIRFTNGLQIVWSNGVNTNAVHTFPVSFISTPAIMTNFWTNGSSQRNSTVKNPTNTGFIPWVWEEGNRELLVTDCAYVAVGKWK